MFFTHRDRERLCRIELMLQAILRTDQPEVKKLVGASEKLDETTQQLQTAIRQNHESNH